MVTDVVGGLDKIWNTNSGIDRTIEPWCSTSSGILLILIIVVFIDTAV